MLGQVMPRAVRLLQFPAGGLSCYINKFIDFSLFPVKLIAGTWLEIIRIRLSHYHLSSSYFQNKEATSCHKSCLQVKSLNISSNNMWPFQPTRILDSSKCYEISWDFTRILQELFSTALLISWVNRNSWVTQKYITT